MASKSKKLSFAADIFEQDIEGIIRKISMAEIQPASDQPRTHFDESINSLAESIKTEGLLQPIVVTKEGTRYKIVAGERRFRAAKIAGLSEIECRILRKNAKDTYRLAVIENLQRENLNAIDEARAFRKLKDDYGHSDGDLAKIVGKSRNYVNEILSVSEIPSTWIEKARTAGIESKNLFIQFAQAVKSGHADTFLDAFKSGVVSTVSAAKQFNKGQKTQTPPKPEAKLNIANFHYKADAKDKTWSIRLDFTTQQSAKAEDERKLEPLLLEAIKRYFK
jgi:ParB family transcriptional regulator, chromosome partitioning protein